MPYPSLEVTDKGLRKIVSGRLWLEQGDLAAPKLLAELPPGALVRLVTREGHFLAVAYVNYRSRIKARILTRKDVPIDQDFFIRRLAQALSWRKKIYPGERCFRLVHGEGDFLPGLTVDVYQDICVVQRSTAGMERLGQEIREALKTLLCPKGLVFRDDLPVRRQEGLSKGVKVWGKVPRPLKVQIDGLWYVLDLVAGQKTGFFLDQRENRRRLGRYVSESTVYDLYCYNGAFALSAARAGAKRVLAVDRSAEALAQAEENARLNGFAHRIVFVQEKVEDFLTKITPASVIVLDPPAFIKHKRHFQAGLKRYRLLNRLALAKVLPEGVLFSSSCSQFLRLSDLEGLLRQEATDYQRSIQVLEYGMQALDHPSVLMMPETMYLKALFLRII